MEPDKLEDLEKRIASLEGQVEDIRVWATVFAVCVAVYWIWKWLS
jgi:hypothetical protein